MALRDQLTSYLTDDYMRVSAPRLPTLDVPTFEVTQSQSGCGDLSFQLSLVQRPANVRLHVLSTSELILDRFNTRLSGSETAVK